MVPNSLVPWCRAWRRHGTNQTGTSRHPAHLSGSRAETRSSCLHPCTPAARCPAHLQERTQQQVTSCPPACPSPTRRSQEPPQPGIQRGDTQLCNASQEVRDCQHLWGNLGKPPPLALVPPGVRGADPPPSPAGPTGVNPSHPPSHAQHPFPCVLPAASALNAIQRQLAFTWFPQDVMEPARIPPIQAWDGEGKPTSGDNSVLEGPDAVAGARLEGRQ